MARSPEAGGLSLPGGGAKPGLVPVGVPGGPAPRAGLGGQRDVTASLVGRKIRSRAWQNDWAWG